MIMNVVSKQRRAVLGAVLLAMGGCAVPDVQARPSAVEIQVVDREAGAALEKHYRSGRTFVAGEAGSRYALRVSNRSPTRVLVVITVDGVNIVTGQTGAWNQVGYVLEPWQTTDLRGWRKSDREIAAFEFTGLRNSYAARTGRPGDVGVIGLAEFAEKVVAPEPPVAMEMSPRRSDGAREQQSPSAAAAESRADSSNEAQAAGQQGRARADDGAQAKLGTGHGERERSVSRRVGFDRASSEPYAVTAIEYDSFSNLVAAGVIEAGRRGGPRPFPNSPSVGFVADPPRR